MPAPKDLLGKPAEKGSITQAADPQRQRVSDISNVAKTVNTMKKDVDQKIKETKFEMGESDNIERVQSSMNKVLSKLSETIGAMATGVKNITIDTAAATKDAIAQYGKAISEDISVNKQNIVAMALSRTTPLFGYFAAKFMETDVFRKAAAKMREGFGNVIGGITNLFRKGAKGVGEKLRGRGGGGAGPPTKPPKMQHGGYVEKGGMAQLHPAEVVMPIEDVLERVDKQVGMARQFMQVARKQQLKSLGKMSVYVADSQKKARVGIVKGILRAWSEVATQYMEPTDKRMLRALLAIQDALGAQIGTMRQVWTKLIIEHPFFRNILFALRAASGLAKWPFKLIYKIFKARGGYRGQLSRSRNPMQATAEHTGLIYAEGMWRLDNIALFTRATAEAVRDISTFITGKRYKKLEGMPTTFWRLSMILTKPFMLAFKGISKTSEWAIKKALVGTKYESLADFLTKERKGLTVTTTQKQLELKQLYGEEGYGTKAIKEKDKKQLNFFDRMKTYVVSENKQKQITNKRGKVLVSNAKEQTKSFNKLRKRLRMGGIMKFIMMAGSMLMTFAKSMFSLSGGLFKTLFKGLGKAALSGLGAAASAIAGMGGLAGIVGSALLLVVAAIIGGLIGTGIEKAFIAPLRRKHMKGMEEIKKKAAEKAQAGKLKTMELAKKQRVSPRLMRAEETRRLQIGGMVQGDISGRYKELKEKDVGFFGRRHLQAIKDSQNAFVDEHMNEYMLYDPTQISALRGKWLAGGGFRTRSIKEHPLLYGERREAAFLEYVKKNLQPTALDEKMIDKVYGTVGKAKEMGVAVLEKSKLVAGAAKEELLKLKGQAKVVGDVMEKVKQKYDVPTGKEVVVAVNNVTNSVVNQLSETTANAMTASREGAGKANSFIQQVIAGDIN